MGVKPQVVDYSRERPDGRPAGSSALVGVAYALIGMPIVGSMFLNGDAPAMVVVAPCMIAVAFGASLFVVRRRRRDNIVGWIGLAVWGLVTLAWIVVGVIGLVLR